MLFSTNLKIAQGPRNSCTTRGFITGILPQCRPHSISLLQSYWSGQLPESPPKQPHLPLQYHLTYSLTNWRSSTSGDTFTYQIRVVYSLSLRSSVKPHINFTTFHELELTNIDLSRSCRSTNIFFHTLWTHDPGCGCLIR